MIITRRCLICKGEFRIKEYRLKHGRGKTCSPKCRYEYQKNTLTGRGKRRSMHNGYHMILKPEHPNAKANGYIFEHRLVVEGFIGRYLLKNEVVHHKNGIRTDNRVENLEILNPSTHNRITGLGRKHSDEYKKYMSIKMREIRSVKKWGHKKI